MNINTLFINKIHQRFLETLLETRQLRFCVSTLPIGSGNRNGETMLLEAR